MRRFLGLTMFTVTLFTMHLPAQEKSLTGDSAPLVLTGAIPLDHGRIDHFGFDPKNRLFVSALGNNAEEVIDLSTQRVVHTITGVPAPQGVVYSPETNKPFVASTKGKVYISFAEPVRRNVPGSLFRSTATLIAGKISGTCWLAKDAVMGNCLPHGLGRSSHWVAILGVGEGKVNAGELRHA